MTPENPAERETAETFPADLVQEFERIDEEKARLRRLADRLGLPSDTRSGPGPAPPAPTPESTHASAPPDADPPAPAAPSLVDLSAPAAESATTAPAEPRVERRREDRRAARRAARRPSLPLSDAATPPAGADPAGTEEGAPRHPRPRGAAPSHDDAGLLETLAGFVPAALYDEVKRERDELFFRLTKLEVERTHVDRLRRSLDSMEGEVRRLEEEIQRRRPGSGPDEAAPLRESYRRWLDLRRRRAVRFSDYLACRRADRDGA